MTTPNAELKVSSIDGLIEKLRNWNIYECDFHENRQLADEVLIHKGWKVEPVSNYDDVFEGGFRWFYGTNPTYNCSESTRPHPLIDISSAVDIIPSKCNWRLEVYPRTGESRCIVWLNTNHKASDIGEGYSQFNNPCIAIVIAALDFMKHGVIE